MHASGDDCDWGPGSGWSWQACSSALSGVGPMAVAVAETSKSHASNCLYDGERGSVQWVRTLSCVICTHSGLKLFFIMLQAT